MPRIKSILIEVNDKKSRNWSRAAKRLNLGELIPVSGSPMYMPFALIGSILRGKIPDAIIMRYVNDYPSFLRTILRTFTDFLNIVIAKISGVLIFWICHNVDKESVSYYPLITLARRCALKKNSKKIFVMDDLLITPCVKALGVSKEKVVGICFGRIDMPDPDEKYESHIVEQTIARIRNWEYFKKSQKGEIKIGLWIGTPTDKKLHGLKILADVISRPAGGDADFAFVVIGPIGKWLRQGATEAYSVLNKSSRVMMIDQYVDLPSHRWIEVCNFIWKPSSDCSINLTAYNSAAASLPLVAFAGTFFGDFIGHYKLGVVIDPDRISSSDLWNKLQQWSPESATAFLEMKTWDHGVRKIFDAATK